MEDEARFSSRPGLANGEGGFAMAMSRHRLVARFAIYWSMSAVFFVLL